MAKRIIREGKPMDPIQVGDIITLKLKDGSIISELLAVPSDASINACRECHLFRNREMHACKCSDGWVVRTPEKYGAGFYKDVALCCTKPVFTMENNPRPEFCRFIKIDTIMENL